MAQRNISKYFKSENINADNKNTSVSDVELQVNYQSPYKHILNEIKRVDLNNSANDFKSPTRLNKAKSKVLSKNVKKVLIKPRKPRNKKKSASNESLNIKIFENNSEITDTNIEHLQMAIALSTSSHNESHLENVESQHLSTPSGNSKRTGTFGLDQFVFKTSNRKIDVQSRRPPMKLKKNRSRSRYITPVLLLRTQEDREKIICDKVALILSHDVLPKHSFNKKCDKPLSNYLQIQFNDEQEIFKKSNYTTEKTCTSDFYVKSLKLEQSDIKSGSLLKDWRDIPGRAISPIQTVERSENSVTQSGSSSEVVECLALPIESRTVENNINLQLNSPDAGELVKSLKLQQSDIKSGSLLKDWPDIPGRAVSPIQTVELSENSVSQSGSSSEVVECLPLPFESRTVENIINLQLNSPDAGEQVNNCHSPDLFDSDDACSPILSTHVKNLKIKPTRSCNKQSSLNVEEYSQSLLNLTPTKRKFEESAHFSNFEDNFLDVTNNIVYQKDNGICIYEKFSEHEDIDLTQLSNEGANDVKVQSMETGISNRFTDALNLLEEECDKDTNESPDVTGYTHEMINETVGGMSSSIKGARLNVHRELYVDDVKVQSLKTGISNRFMDALNLLKEDSERDTNESPDVTGYTHEMSDETIEGKSNNLHAPLSNEHQELYVGDINLLCLTKTVKDQVYDLTQTSESEVEMDTCSSPAVAKVNDSIGNRDDTIKSNSSFVKYASFNSTKSDESIYISDDEINYSCVYSTPVNAKKKRNNLKHSERSSNFDHSIEIPNFEGLNNDASQEVVAEANISLNNLHEETILYAIGDDAENHNQVASNDSAATPKTDVIIKSNNVTPMTDYSQMNTPKIRKELEKFGLKPLKRQRGIKLLNYIYETTHPLVGYGDKSDSQGVDHELNPKRKRSCMKSKKYARSNSDGDRRNTQNLESNRIAGDILGPNGVTCSASHYIVGSGDKCDNQGVDDELNRKRSGMKSKKYTRSNSDGDRRNTDDLEFNRIVGDILGTCSSSPNGVTCSASNYIVGSDHIRDSHGVDHDLKPKRKRSSMKSKKYSQSNMDQMLNSDGNNRNVDDLESNRIVGDILGNDNEELIFERKLSKRILSCRVPLHIAWYNLVASDTNLQKNILLYEPLQLEVVYRSLKQYGYNYHINDLLLFLDKKCITIRSEQNSRQRHKKKKPSSL